MSIQESRKSFFLHGGLMIVATVAGGFFMLLVQVIARYFMAAAEYSVFFALLRVYLIMGVPSGGLQTVFTQQCASALTDEQTRQLNGTTRTVLTWTFVLWLFIAAAVLASSQFWIDLLKIPKPAALWLTLLLGLASLWLPILKGLLQGRQNFTGLGWVLIVDAVGRFLPVVVIFILLGGQSTGAMVGVVIGQTASIGAAAWLTRKTWLGKGAPFDARAWRGRVIPLTLGTGAVLIMSNADVLFVQSLFSSKQEFYMVAAMIGLALTQVITPLAVVMYPKIARSAAKSEKTDAMTLTLKASAALGCLAAVVCTLTPWLPVTIIFPLNPQKNMPAAVLVPWAAWAFLAIALANVLIANLLARERYEVVPWLVILALGYVTTLLALSPHFVAAPAFTAFTWIIQILGFFNLLLLAAACLFTYFFRASTKN